MKSKANVMVLKAENQEESRLDWLKWLVALTLLLVGVFGNYYYSNQISMPIRTAAWFVVVAAAGFIASRTKKGKWVVDFFRESRLELRKVVWPTRQETTQTTMVVCVVVVIVGLMLWGLDSILVWAIGWLTGQRG